MSSLNLGGDVLAEVPQCGSFILMLHFSGKLKEAFFDLRYRNISHGSHLVKERQKRTYPKERSGDGR